MTEQADKIMKSSELTVFHNASSRSLVVFLFTVLLVSFNGYLLSGQTCGSAPTDTVTGLNFGTITLNSIQLNSFTAPVNGAAGYIIKVNANNTFSSPALIDTLPDADTAYLSGEQVVYAGSSTSGVTVTGFNANTPYYFRVYAYNACTNPDTFTYETIGAKANMITKQKPIINISDTIYKTYGDPDFNFTGTSTSSGTISYETVGDANGTSLSGPNNMTVNIGNADTLTIRLKVAASGNYVADSLDFYLAIDKANLTATADDKIRSQSDANPVLTISYLGFKNGDGKDDIDIEPSISTTATSSSPPGTYPIQLTGGQDNNYSFTLIDGLLTIISDPIRELVNDGNSLQEIAPQGGLRYQRGFYLITSDEMESSELEKDSLINAIGFTLAESQNMVTRGNLKVFLQNTTDIHSRIDTMWTTTSTQINSFDTAGLVSGEYEWQIQTICASGISTFTDLSEFATVDTSACNTPTNPMVDDITSTSATWHWTRPASQGFSQYSVSYGEAAGTSLSTFTTSDTFFIITGLAPDTQYQFRVQSVCSGGTSSEAVSFFKTLNQNVCDPPSNPIAISLTDTSATLSWTTPADSNYYDVRYRRAGSTNWIGLLSFSDSIVISGLTSGTFYEWQIRTVCSAGSGAYVPASTFFMTTGASACYPPENLRTNVLNDTSAILLWDSVPGAISYNIRFRLKNSISWTNATGPMKLVHLDSVNIPNNIGTFRIPFKGGMDTIHYGGQGLYVAWEYSNSTGPISSLNTALATSANNNIKDINGQDSITFVLSLLANSDNMASGHKETLLATSLRPETWLGTNGLADSVEVGAVYALGHHALSYLDTAHISTLILNHSSTSKSYPVILQVKEQGSGMLLHSDTIDVMVAGDTSALVEFKSWVPQKVGRDSIIISVASQGAENVLANNRNYYLQMVNGSTVSYDDGSSAVGSTGFGTDGGLILSRLKMDGCGSVIGARIYLDFSAKEKELYAVVMDGSGGLVDSSYFFTPDSTEVNNYHTFYFSKNPFFDNDDYYIGLAQTPSSGAGYYPVGVQWETANIRDSAFYRADIDGNNLMNHPTPGRLMIQAILTPGRSLPVIKGDTILCAGTTDTLKVGSKISRFANSVVSVSSEYSNVNYSSSQALGVPDVYPAYGNSNNHWIGSSEDGQRESIVLGFPNPGPINFIDIYETQNPGAIDTVFVRNDMGMFVPVYMDTASIDNPIATVRHISFDTTLFDVSEIRIVLASPSVPGFNGIDAVAIGLESDTSSFAGYLWSTSSMDNDPFIEISSAGTYLVTVTDDLGCQYVDSIMVSTPSQADPVISVADGLSSTFCQGDSITLRSDKFSGNVWNTSAITDSITVKNAGSYFITFDDGSGCGTKMSNTIQVTIDTLPVPAISGTLGFCPGGSTTLDAGPGYTSYLWSNDSTFQTTDISTTGSYSVIVTDGNGCAGTSPSVITFNTSSISPGISGNLSVCPGDSTLLDAGTYSTYSWSSGETSQTIFVGPAETVFITVTDAQGCIGTANTSTFNAPPLTISISGDLGFCPGDSTILDAGMYNTYLWSSGENTQTISVKDDQTVYVTVTDSHGCSGSTFVTTSSFTPPAPSITGALSFCPGDSTTLNAGNYSSYSWSSGETSQTIFVKSALTTEVTVTDGNGCSNSTSVNTSLFSTPVPTILGDLGFCPGDSTMLSAGGSFSSYLWSNGANTISTTISTPGSYSVTVTDGNGCEGNRNVMVSQYNVPEPFISGTLSFCGGSSTRLNAGEGYLSYLWSSGETSQAIFVEKTGAYSVTVTDLNGCFGDTTVVVTENGSVPQIPGPITGPTSVMGDPTLTQYSIDPVPNTSFYVWTVPEGVTIIGNDEGTAITVRIDSFSNSLIIAEAANACGLSPSTNASTIGLTPPTFGDCNQAQLIVDDSPIPIGIYQGNVINSAGNVPNNGYVLFKAASTANLNFSFNVELGATFEIEITDCGTQTSARPDRDVHINGVN